MFQLMIKQLLLISLGFCFMLQATQVQQKPRTIKIIKLPDGGTKAIYQASPTCLWVIVQDKYHQTMSEKFVCKPKKPLIIKPGTSTISGTNLGNLSI